MARFPSLKAKQLLKILEREPLNYRVHRRRGSHRVMKASGRPTIMFAVHDKQTIRPHTVRSILCDQVGLEEDEALKLL